MEYCIVIQLWNPYLKQDKEKLQRKCKAEPQNIQGCKDLSYEERLKMCELTTLEERRSRRDLVKARKIITGNKSIQWERFFELGPSKVTWGHR